MAKARTSRTRSSESKPADPDPELEPAPAPAPAPKVVSIKAAPVITLSVFARRFPKNAVMRAVQDCERLTQAHTRKRTRGGWQSDFDAFLQAPR